MLELGAASEQLHAKVADAVAASHIDLVFTAGPQMRALHDALPPARRGPWAESSTGIESTLLDRVRGGDAVMIKGSNGSRMGPLVAALRARFAVLPAADETATAG
jgi:UDP-N-acetylmuramoyl-tripeptide--D-alanyl-D-alanine ligase